MEPWEPRPLDVLAARLAARAAAARKWRYRVPALWNAWGYEPARRTGRGEIEVDPYAFLLDCLHRVILPARGDRRLAGRSLSAVLGVRPVGERTVLDGPKRRRGGDWIRVGSIYGLFVRMTTAWDHDGDGDLSSQRFTETGTFLKSILLLPLLRRMGVGAIYLLPVSRHSNLYRKGELGCPYSARNFFEIEPSLHDRLLGDDASDVEMEFGAFVETAHALRMRVLLDLAPRTTSRDCDWILEHPEWFYWIDRRWERDYNSPRIEGAGYSIPRPADLPDIHARRHFRKHLAKFRFAPNVTAPMQWRRFVEQMRADPPRDLLAHIGRRFGVITPPGFSDCVNDPQPPWSDVTFLRYYWDHPIAVQRVLPDPQAQPPYLFSETIKSSRFPGRKPNVELWKRLADILPFYQRFGVDGARIDMGHALPAELERMILAAPRRTDPDFAFIAEELGTENAAKARRAGYNLIIGPSWWMEPRAGQGRFHELAALVLPASKLPAWAAAETPDTPRAVVREGGRRFARLAAAVNHFLPNAVPFINSGMEMHERQPMNLGLDNSESGRYVLSRSDPFHGKLAFFDRYVLHWGNAGAASMIKLLADAAAVRARFADDLADPAKALPVKVTTNDRRVLAVAFRVDRGRAVLLVAANTDFHSVRRAVVSNLPRGRGAKPELLLAVERAATPPRSVGGRLHLALPPGGVQVVLLRNVACS
jgi:hypothetical protein